MENNKKLQFIELILFLGVVLLPSILTSVYAFFSKLDVISLRGGSPSFHYLHGITWELLSICLLIYFLYRRGKGLADIGFSFKWKDLLEGMGIFLLVSIVNIILYNVLKIFSINPEQPRNIDFLKSEITIFYVLFILINPFFEELIVRAFTMIEVGLLTGRTYLAIIISTLLQTSYHLYQGTYATIVLLVMFLVFSIIFAKYKRIMPLIIAHAIFDIIALLQNAII